MCLKKSSDSLDVAYAGDSQLDTLHITMFDLLEKQVYKGIFCRLAVAGLNLIKYVQKLIFYEQYVQGSPMYRVVISQMFEFANLSEKLQSFYYEAREQLISR